MRYYFNLTNRMETIPDTEGVEAETLLLAQDQALKAIQELREEDDTAEQDWAGWRMEVTNPAGELMLVFDLGHSLS